MPAMKREYNLNMAAVQTLASYNEIVAFCKRWKVVEFALFGSALRDDFSPESDVDALVSFAPDSNWCLFEHVQMRQELKSIFARDVDLITRRALEQSRNTLLRSEILSTAKVVFSHFTHPIQLHSRMGKLPGSVLDLDPLWPAVRCHPYK
jgi:predicted nucleotidyltransferase